MFSTDPLSNWFSAVALSHGIIENPAEKEQLLKVMLATSPGASPVSLLHQCSLLLQQVFSLSLFLLLSFNYLNGIKMNDDVCFQSNQVQSKFGLLILLSTWLSHCPQAVSQFLSIPSNIPFLTAQVYSHATFF